MRSSPRMAECTDRCALLLVVRQAETDLCLPCHYLLQEMYDMGLRPQYEILTKDGLFSIDIAVKWQGR